MIEFDGYLSGEAEKRFLKRSKDMVHSAFLFAMFMLLPVIIYIVFKMKTWLIVYIYVTCATLFLLMLQIPKSKTERLALVPKRIYVEEDHIVCIANKYTESRLIEDVTKVLDYGPFYELYFPFGKLSDKFICQKDLLTKGTLEEFESLFGDKLQRWY